MKILIIPSDRFKDRLIHTLNNGDLKEIRENVPKWEEGDLPCTFSEVVAHIGVTYRGEFRYIIKPLGRGTKLIEGKIYNHSEKGLIAIFTIGGKKCYFQVKN